MRTERVGKFSGYAFQSEYRCERKHQRFYEKITRGRVTVEKTTEQFHKGRDGSGGFRVEDAAPFVSGNHCLHHLSGGHDLGVVYQRGAVAVDYQCERVLAE